MRGEKAEYYYVVSSGGLILKGFDSEDKVYLEGDLADPLSVVGGEHSGDLLCVGDSAILVGDRDELKEYLVSRPERLEKLFVDVEKDLSLCSGKGPFDLDEFTASLVAKKQCWLEEYPPLLFGEKSLYRKGIRLIERKDYPSAQEVLRSYLDQYQNSPLSRPVKLFYAFSCFLNDFLEDALASIMDILESAEDEISRIARFFVCHMGLFESGFKFLYRGPRYSSDLFRILKADYLRIRKAGSDRIVFEEGRKAGSVLFLLKGEIALLKKRGDKNSVLFTIKSPSSIGEIQVLSRSKWDTTLKIKSNSEYILIDRDKLVQYLIHKSPQDGFRMVEYLLGYIRQTSAT
ncbi:MAG: cyclic nucleotide-binding domain-containing protein [Mesotoga sp.]|nr:cyclic nucleotide-binding domain-containing protein [Mesotoga sp.]